MLSVAYRPARPSATTGVDGFFRPDRRRDPGPLLASRAVSINAPTNRQPISSCSWTGAWQRLQPAPSRPAANHSAQCWFRLVSIGNCHTGIQECQYVQWWPVIAFALANPPAAYPGRPLPRRTTPIHWPSGDLSRSTPRSLPRADCAPRLDYHGSGTWPLRNERRAELGRPYRASVGFPSPRQTVFSTQHRFYPQAQAPCLTTTREPVEKRETR